MDTEEAKQKEWDRAQEREENRKNRRNTVIIAVIAAIAATAAAFGGAKWGAAGQIEADRQKRINDLCLELNTQLEKTSSEVFSPRSKFSKEEDPSIEHSERWDDLSHWPGGPAPVPIYIATDNVSVIVREVGESTFVTLARRGWGVSTRTVRTWQAAQKDPNKTRSLAQSLTPEFDKAADDLRGACREELGEDPLPTPR